ncbi:MAG: type II toxin-antitoxin system HicB family antitoxin [Nitrospirae bacterium]|nr:type II toxin-antitoxin system HicB family antitoxin [Nitrospirota bacterium]MBF0618438.1 type II toxin-antitoxin system HicB family antitoxin [Nitrospirota bacterium]
MSNHAIKLNKDKTYVFTVVIEPDENEWFAYCPVLRAEGAATCGNTQGEALRNIQEVVEMIVEELIEDGKHIPEEDIKIYSDVEIKTAVSG